MEEQDSLGVCWEGIMHTQGDAQEVPSLYPEHTHTQNLHNHTAIENGRKKNINTQIKKN